MSKSKSKSRRRANQSTSITVTTTVSPERPSKPPEVQPVWDCVETLLLSNPVPYTLHPNHSTSTGTRPPKHFDLHLSPQLQLQRLVFAKTLPQKLSELCDQRISSLRKGDDNQHTAEPLDLSALMDTALEAPPGVLAESGLVSDYPRRTALPCLPLASTIAFGLTVNWKNVFGWKSQDSNNGATGLCDGYLLVDMDKGKIDQLSDIQRKEIELLQRHRLEHLAIFEFKSLVAGDLPTMQAIVDLARRGDFTWMTCHAKHHVAGLLKCDATKHLKNGVPSVTGRTTGPDARDLWEEPMPTLASTSIEEPDIAQAYQIKAYHITQQVYAEMVNADATLAVISSGNIEIFLRRNRASQTLYVSDIIYPDRATDPTHYKLHTSLYFAGYIDALDRARQIDELLQSLKGSSSSNSIVALPEWASDYFSNSYEDDSYRSKGKNVAPSGLSEHITPGSKLSLKERKVLAKATADISKELFDRLRKAEQVWIRLPHVRADSEEPKLYCRKRVHRVDSHCQGGTATETVGHEGGTSSNDILIGSQPADYDSSACSPLSPVLQDVALHSDSELDVPQAIDDEKREVHFQIETRSKPIEGGSKAYYGSVTQFDSQNHARSFSQALVVKLAISTVEKKHLQKDYEGHCLNPALLPYGLFTSADKSTDYDVLLLQDGGRSLDTLLDCKPTPEVKQGYLNEIIGGAMTNLHAKGLQHNNIIPSHVVYKDKGQKRKFNLISYGQATEISPSKLDESEEGRERKRAKVLDEDAKPLRSLLERRRT